MPELPEVEVVKRSLESQIINLTLKKVKINDGNLRYKVKKQDLKKIIGLKIQKIIRRSKYLLFFFDKNFTMVAHLGMTGKFFLINKNKKIFKTSFYYQIEDSLKKHNRIIFYFSGNLQLIFNDVRKFGFIKIFSKNNINNVEHLKLLGPEPLSSNFNFEYFKSYLKGKKRNIKDLLMDQKFLSGLGNIYANEILFLSKINPKRKIVKLTDQNIINIIKHTKTVLKKAISLGGSSIKNFSNSEGKKGNFQQLFNVYGRKNEKCSNADCNGKIKKINLSNRSSFFCVLCQK